MNAVYKTYYLPSVLIVSGAVLGWQIGLMRCLLITRYYHFSFLIISCALLGFGIGGVILSSFQKWFDSHGQDFFRWGCLAFGVSIPVCFRLGEWIPLRVYFPPEDLFAVILWWVVYWVIQTFPFVLAGALTGWALSGYIARINHVYACSLVGASLGVTGTMFFLSTYSPNALIIPLGLLVMVGCVTFVVPRAVKASLLYSVCLGASSFVLTTASLLDVDKVFPMNVDEYKNLAYVQRLATQQAAQRNIILEGLRGRVELYASPYFHALLSFASSRRLSPMDILLKDGVQIGTIPVVRSLSEVAFLSDTLFAIPYRLVKPQRVLILGEAGAIHLWTARLQECELIVLVQPDKNVLEVLRSHPSRPLDDPRIRIYVGDTRAFLDNMNAKFDIIQLAELEGFIAGSSGIGGLRENYLATVEGFQKCLETLTPEGVACSVRGIQDPPRDNIKILSTWFEALGETKSRDASNHVLMARDELSCAILCWRSKVPPKVSRQFAALCEEKSWESEWFPGIKAESTNKIHKLPGPEGASVSWYHEAITQFRSHQQERFYQGWISHVRPATDDSPYYFDFFRLASVSPLKRIFGPLWPTRSEMGFLVLLVCLAATVFAASLLVGVALFAVAKRRSQPVGRGFLWVLSFFTAIGSAFMLVEMLLIQTFTRFLGDPVISAGTVLGALLLFSGFGSMLQPFVTQRGSKDIFVIGLLIAGVLVFAHVGISFLQPLASGFDTLTKIILALSIMAPIGFLMGMPFPWAMSIINTRTKDAVPIAWAMNCFASVVSSPLAIIIAMSLGFRFLWIVASLLYGSVGLLALLEKRALPQMNQQRA